MKMTKTRLRNRIGESSLSYLLKIAIESPEKLCEMELENIVDTLTYQRYLNQSIICATFGTWRTYFANYMRRHTN